MTYDHPWSHLGYFLPSNPDDRDMNLRPRLKFATTLKKAAPMYDDTLKFSLACMGMVAIQHDDSGWEKRKYDYHDESESTT